jgi:hypothetical protein
MAVEPDFIRPLMLMVVQDDNYDLIHMSIIANPWLTIPQFLDNLRDRVNVETCQILMDKNVRRMTVKWTFDPTPSLSQP